MKISRRKILYLGSIIAASGASYGLLKGCIPLGAQNQSVKRTEDHFFVICSAPGGMDVSLGLDPYVDFSNVVGSRVFLEYGEPDLKQAGSLKFGPAATSLAKYYKDICIVNGISGLQDFGHFGNLNQMLTGSMLNNRPNLADYVSSKHSSLPFGIISNTDIKSKLNRADITDTEYLQNLMLHSERKILPDEVLPLMDSNILSALQKTNAGLDEARIRFNKSGPHKNYAETIFSSVASSFSAKLASEAIIDLTYLTGAENLDSHTLHAKKHLESQQKIWQAVSELFDVFKNTAYLESSLFEYTTFLVVSEFSRQPYLNAFGGKEHNPLTNSVLFAGKKINGNCVLGRSSLVLPLHADQTPSHRADYLDMRNGRVSKVKTEDHTVMTAEYLKNSVDRIFSLNLGQNNLPIPGLVKS